MVEESSVLLAPAEEAETDTALELEPESGEPPEPTIEPGFVCNCEESMRSACERLPFYKEHESRRYCVLHYPGKEKSADFKAALDSKLNSKDFDFQGVWFPDEVHFSGFEFNSAADFSAATFSALADFTQATFSAGADFSHVTFSADADFSEATFSVDADSSGATIIARRDSRGADFRSATFSARAGFDCATFSATADFNFAKFSATASFWSATFSVSADFVRATFSALAYFRSATFSAAAYFNSAMFSDADFDLSVFNARADFSEASFNDSIHFFGGATEWLLKDGTSIAPMALGKDPSLVFQHVRIEHPERIAFHTLNLRPHWFVNVDSRRFVFTDVSWEWKRLSIKQEIAALESNRERELALGFEERVSSPNHLLAITCRQLAENAEANNRYEEASNFRYWAMDLARRIKWNGWSFWKKSFWKTDWLHMLYWAVSGYGERILRALGVLAAVWIVFAGLYTQVGFKQATTNTSTEPAATIAVEDSLREFSRALTYSLAVMSLQKPEPKPLTGTAQTLVLLETILGPVQGALLLLAIRRKFMR